MPRVISTQVAGCPFCTTPILVAFNDRIFERDKDNVVAIEASNASGIDIAEAEVRMHRKHLTRIEFDLDGLFEEKELLNNDATNLEIIKARVNRVRAILLEMEKDTVYIMGKDYTALLGQFTRLMELKAKLEGQIIEKHEGSYSVAEIVAKLKQPGDADV